MAVLGSGSAYSIVGSSGSQFAYNLVKTAYDKAVDFKLRSQPMYRQAVQMRKVSELTQPGETVVFTLWNELAPKANSNLHETDPAVARSLPATSSVQVTINEFGDVVVPSWRARTFSFADIDQGIAITLANTAADDVDQRVRTVLLGSTNVIRSDSGTAALGANKAQNTLDDGDVLTGKIVRSVIAKLRGASAIPLRGNLFGAYIHPDQSLDLQEDTGAGGWAGPHTYVDTGNIYAGEIGTYQGAFFVESPRVLKDELGADRDGSGSGTALFNTYQAFFLGGQALCEAVAEEVNVTIGPVTDPHNRHRPLGYHAAMGWAIYRQDCLWKVETGSSNDLV